MKIDFNKKYEFDGELYTINKIHPEEKDIVEIEPEPGTKHDTSWEWFGNLKEVD